MSNVETSYYGVSIYKVLTETKEKHEWQMLFVLLFWGKLESPMKRLFYFVPKILSPASPRPGRM